MVPDDEGHANDGDGDDKKGDAEEQGELELAHDRELGFIDQRERDEDEHDVGDDVEGAHGDELRCGDDARSRFRPNLPVSVARAGVSESAM